jgi:hypothetical protein
MLKALILMLAVTVGGSAAYAQDGTGDANDFLSQYDAASPTGRQLLEMFIIGQERGILVANQFLKVARSKNTIYCPPDDAALAPTQLVDMTRKTVASDGRIGTMPLSVVVLMTLQRNYPCAKTDRPKN